MNTKYSAADILGMIAPMADLAKPSTFNLDKFKLSFQGTQAYLAVPPRIWPHRDLVQEVEDKLCRLDDHLTDNVNQQIVTDKSLANTPDSKFSTGCGFLGQVGIVSQSDPINDLAVAVDFRYYVGAHIASDEEGHTFLTASGQSDRHLHDQALTCCIGSTGDLRHMTIAVDLKVLACMAFHQINKMFIAMWGDDTLSPRDAATMLHNGMTDEKLRIAVMKQHLAMMKDGTMLEMQMRTIRAVLDHAVGEFNEYLDISDSVPAHERATMYNLVARALTVWMDYQGDVMASVIQKMIAHTADLYFLGGSIIEEIFEPVVAMMLQENSRAALRIKFPAVMKDIKNQVKHPKFTKVPHCSRNKK